jgi:hypothetical protein
MKTMSKKSYILLIILGLLLLTSCAQSVNGFGRPAYNTRQVAVTMDPLYTSLPAYRIDNQMRRISIVGSGPDYERIQSALTKLFTERTEVKVIEPANLQSVLAGKIIEYQTGISPADAQLLSRMFQIDHVLLFDVEIAPYSAYKLGGKNYAVINLKIVNTVNGEILFQASHGAQATVDDPHKYGYGYVNETDLPGVRNAALASLAYELRYALNDAMMGWVLNPGTNVVGDVLVGSVADKAGIQKGDAIVGINDTKISTDQDILALANRKALKQGEEATIKMERNGKMSKRRVVFPVIPVRPQTKWDKQTEEGTEESPGDKSKTLDF